MAPSVGSRSWMTGSSARSSSSDGICSIRPASSSFWTNGRSRSIRSSALRRRIHWPFSHSSRSRSNTAPPLCTCADVEPLDDLVERKDLLLGPGGPAEEREVVDQRLGDEAFVDVGVDRGLALALAHLRAVRVEDERQVREARHVVAQRSEQEDVLGRVREVVLAADDVGHLHRRVVDDDREVVQRRCRRRGR